MPRFERWSLCTRRSGRSWSANWMKSCAKRITVFVTSHAVRKRARHFAPSPSWPGRASRFRRRRGPDTNRQLEGSDPMGRSPAFYEVADALRESGCPICRLRDRESEVFQPTTDSGGARRSPPGPSQGDRGGPWAVKHTGQPAHKCIPPGIHGGFTQFFLPRRTLNTFQGTLQPRHGTCQHLSMTPRLVFTLRFVETCRLPTVSPSFGNSR